MEKGAVRKTRFNREGRGEGRGGNGFNKAVTLQKRMSPFHGPMEWD